MKPWAIRQWQQTREEAPMLEITENQIEIWHLQVPKSLPVSEIQRLKLLLSPNEITKLSEFPFLKDQTEYLMTRCFLRGRLAEYYGLPPESFSFTTNHKKRPELATSQLPYKIHFSISHTAGLISCAFARFPEVGIDVENIQRDLKFIELGETVFSPVEMKFLKSQNELHQRKVFYLLWTLKEAYLKALGVGLVDNLHEFEFCLDSNYRPTSLKRSKQFFDQSDPWSFQVFDPSPDHQLALVYRNNGQTLPNIMQHNLPSL